MASGVSVIVKSLNIKGMHVDRLEYMETKTTRNNEEFISYQIEVHVRPYKRLMRRCPKCGNYCSCYDHQAKSESSWRANSLNGVPVILKYKPTRIYCLKHGVLNEAMPWTDGNSRFTEGFNNEAAYLALLCPKTVVAEYLDINWRTVGNCIKAAHDRLEPDVTERLHGLRRICVDETSYKKGHKYITVVYDVDLARVVWLHDGHGLEVFKRFCELLTKEEQENIEVVAGDGADWIDQCCKQYFVNAKRCTDFFHVVGWVNEALDKVRNSARSRAEHEVEDMKKELLKAEEEEKEAIRQTEAELKKSEDELKTLPTRGRPSKRKIELEQYIAELRQKLQAYKESQEINISEEEYKAALEELEKMPKRGRRSRRKAELITIVTLYEKARGNERITLSEVHRKIIDDLEKKAKDIKGTKYALGMNPENLSESLRDKLKLVEETHPEVFKAYQLKEKIRIILHMKDLKTAEAALKQWLTEAEDSDIPQFKKLCKKIKKHMKNILNAVELQMNSARSEATNTTIKALIATARGFHNLSNMFALIYLRCSDIVIPLNNRYRPDNRKQQELRDLQNERKRQREEAKRQSYLKMTQV